MEILGMAMKRGENMKRIFRACILSLLFICLTACSAGAEQAIQINGELEPKTQEETLEMLLEAREAFFQDEALTDQMQKGLTIDTAEDPFETGEGEVYTFGTVTYQGKTMRFLMDVIGDADENGQYPLYITLHGGGGAPAEDNDSQWFMMYDYYREAVDTGIYIACRGISDTWDLHFQPDSYLLYDRLIQSMIRLFRADPNRVYLLGFSAGGDGVYQITPRMADRFAAANMSSGHPNGVSLRNLCSCPFSIQLGVRDYYSEDAMRCVRGAEYAQVLQDYQDALGYGYTHQVLIHVPEGHNYNDYGDSSAEVLANPAAFADPSIVENMMNSFLDALSSTTEEYGVGSLSYYSPGENEAFDEAIKKIVKEDFQLETTFVNANAIAYVSQFTRNPAPETVVWDLSTRAASREVSSFYWLKADPSVTEGLITATLTGDNTIKIVPENVKGDFSILVNPTLLDVSKPIWIKTPDGTIEVHVNPSWDTMLSSMRETGDPSLAWVAEIPYSVLHP